MTVLKKSKKANIEVFDANFFSIDEPYWGYIIENMHKEGLISGVLTFPILGKAENGVKITPEVKITPKGIQFLEENSMLQKIKGAVKDIADIIPI